MKTWMKAFSFITIALSLLVSSGCVNSQHERISRRLELAPELNSHVIAQDLFITTQNADFSEAQSIVVNQSKLDKYIQYRFLWLTSEGTAAHHAIWQDLYLSPLEKVRVTGISPNSDSRDFRFQLRPASVQDL